jgi:hypothetical protein
MSPSQRKTLIRKDHTALSLTRQCKLLRISRSSLYYTPAGINAETLKLMNEIDRVFTNIRSLAAARLQPACQDTGSTQAVIACVA